ncbi:MAG: transposase, partial [Candidatus Micrarchaeaceae archaeon]
LTLCYPGTKRRRLCRAGVMLRLMQHHMDAVLSTEPALKQELVASQQRLEQAATYFRAEAAKTTPPALTGLLMTIPGIGTVTAAILIAEIGDITRFKGAQCLIAYAGLDPRVRQSGMSLKRNTHLTKRGSPYLRRALYLAAAAAERHDAELKATYDRKRAEGKRYREATIVVARKLLTRVYAVWKRDQPYKIRTIA